MHKELTDVEGTREYMAWLKGEARGGESGQDGWES